MQAARLSAHLREVYDALMTQGEQHLSAAAGRPAGGSERHVAYVSALVALAKAEQVAQTGVQTTTSDEFSRWLNRHAEARRKQQMASGALLAWFAEKPVEVAS